MDPASSRGPASAGHRSAAHLVPALTILVADPSWRRAVPGAEAIVRRAARAAGPAEGAATSVVLTDDRTMQRLNARHRGRNKPTNVLSFDPPARQLPGELVLALGVIRREAAAAGRTPGQHLAHLVVHGTLHLRGHDHLAPAQAQRMEMAEARILHRIGVPNPWKRR